MTTVIIALRKLSYPRPRQLFEVHAVNCFVSLLALSPLQCYRRVYNLRLLVCLLMLCYIKLGYVVSKALRRFKLRFGKIVLYCIPVASIFVGA
jgi:hypothetical protein